MITDLMDPDTQAEKTAEKIAKELAKSVAFAQISIHMWRGQFHIKQAEVQVGDLTVSKDIVTKPRWNLMPKEWHDRFTAVESKLKIALDRARLKDSGDKQNEAVKEELRKYAKNPVRGISIIPRKNLVRFFEQIEEIEKGEFTDLVKSFGEQWNDVIAWAKAEVRQDAEKQKVDWEKTWALIDKLMPVDAEEVTSKFWIEKHIIPIQLGTDMGLEYLTGSDAEAYIGKIREYGRKFTEQMTESIIGSLEVELTEAIDNLVNRINAGGVIRDGTLGMVRNAFDKYKALDFVMTDDLRAKMETVGKELNQHTCQDYNKDLKDYKNSKKAASMTIGLAKALESIQAQCVKESAVVRFHGRAKRNIKV